MVGLRTNTVVSGISPDGSRIAGVSGSPESSTTDATTWLSSAPDTPIGTGPHTDAFFGNLVREIRPTAAWNGGVVGFFRNAYFIPFRWEPNSYTFVGQAPNDYFLFGLMVTDVSADGSVIVGSSGDPGQFQGHWWDGSGNRTTISGLPQTVSPNGNWIGGVRGNEPSSSRPIEAQVWTKQETGYVAELLMMESAGALEEIYFSSVVGITDSGYTIGSGQPNFGPSENFIWHESFNGTDSMFLGAQNFDEWLMAVGGVALPSPSDDAPHRLVGIIESDGILHVAVNSGDQAFVVSINTVPEPTSKTILLIAMAGMVLRRRKISNALLSG